MADAQSSESEAPPVPHPTDLTAYAARLQSAIIPPTRIAGTLPLGSSLAYQRTLDRATAKELDTVSGRVLGLIDKLVKYSGGKGKGKTLGADDLLEARDYQALVGDVLDQLLENADICLDEFAGRNKAPAIDVKVPALKPSQPHKLSQALLHAANLPKPQLKFKTPPDNTPLAFPYVPPPHPNPAPYANEPPASLLSPAPPASISSFESTPFTFVDTPESLRSMVTSLENVTEIALDVEHNSMRTYKGLVCLVQLSSRTQDWVIDTLALREELGILRGVLEDPNIVKVLHGAESDVVWLQRDFGLFIVGLFDTYHASRVLGFPKRSLAALLARYTDFIPSKQYQLADWRIRPLPDEMLHYARADTHFLLHIYDQLRNALLKHSTTHPPLPPTPPNGTPPPDTTITSASASVSMAEESGHPWAIVRVLARSAATAGKLYTPEIPNPIGLARRWDLQLGNDRARSPRSTSPSSDDGGAKKRRQPIEQKAAVFESVFWWRDKVARLEDESPIYVLANTALFQIATSAPTTTVGLYKTVPRFSVPARQHAEGLIEAVVEGIQKAKREEAAWKQHAEEERKEQEEKTRNQRERAIQQDTMEVSATPVAAVDLWNRLGAGQTVKATSISSLFGPKPALPVLQAPSQRATQSTLLGPSIPRKVLPRPPSLLSGSFEALRQRIHGAISNAPTPVPAQDIARPTSEPVIPPAPILVVDPPPPPVATPVEPNADEILVVAQPRTRSKKRKADTGSAQEPKKARAEVEEFDYASAPNILDQGVDEEEAKTGKREKRKATNVYGNFPAPPKAQSEQRRGNRTQSFK